MKLTETEKRKRAEHAQREKKILEVAKSIAAEGEYDMHGNERYLSVSLWKLAEYLAALN